MEEHLKLGAGVVEAERAQPGVQPHVPVSLAAALLHSCRVHSGQSVRIKHLLHWSLSDITHFFGLSLPVHVRPYFVFWRDLGNIFIK